MKRILLAAVHVAAFALPALAQGYPHRPMAVVVPGGLGSDEMLDDRRDRVERRQELERRVLRLHQRAERRYLGIDQDD